MFLLELFKHRHNRHEQNASNKKLLYKGIYYHGNATYEYFDFKDYRIFCGLFSYKNTFKSLNQTRGEKSVKGYYSNNKKSGLWEYRCKEDNMKRNLKVEYLYGTQSGIYEYHRKGEFYSNYKHCCDTYIHAVMENGHPVGMIKAFIDNSYISGKCDSHGYPDGTWYMDVENETRRITYYEIWDHGLLVDYYRIDITTGNRYDEKIDILVKIKWFVKDECYPVESIIKKGSIRWHGNILTKKDKKVL